MSAYQFYQFLSLKTDTHSYPFTLSHALTDGFRYQATHEQWLKGTFMPTSLTLPDVGLPLDISTVQTMTEFGRTAPNLRGIVVADGATQQLRVFDENGKPYGVGTIGLAGGHDDGNPAVRDDVFMWRTGPNNTMNDFQAAVACDDDGSVTVTDGGNRRIMRFNATTGALLGTPLMVLLLTTPQI